MKENPLEGGLFVKRSSERGGKRAPLSAEGSRDSGDVLNCINVEVLCVKIGGSWELRRAGCGRCFGSGEVSGRCPEIKIRSDV